MYQLVIYRNNEVFEPYVETTSELRDSFKTQGGQFNTKTRRYQMPLTGYESFISTLVEMGLNFNIVTRELPDEKTKGVKRAIIQDNKPDTQVEIRVFNDHLETHFKYMKEIVDTIKSVPNREFVVKGDNKWWTFPVEQIDALTEALCQNNISFKTISQN